MQAIDPAIGLANRVLEREDWARTRLSSHAGRTIRIVCGPFASTLSIAASGMLVAAQGTTDQALSLTLSIPPLRVPTLLAQPERWTELVAVEGDAELASTLAELAQTLPWFVEQSLASVFGPLVGTRVADAGRALLALPEHAARSFSSSLSSYSRDESGLGVNAAAFADFSAEIAAIATRVDALAARFDQAADARRAKSVPGRKPAQ
jgi:ubiquinone biosynthesis accessory factor UbiJ